MLVKISGHHGLMWVTAPDVVADARSTLKMFDEWHIELAGAGLPVAFVGQDGQEDVDVPWDRFVCLFIGGSTKWKLSETSSDLIAEAKYRGKLVHMGRVNSLRRISQAYYLGCDSVDGSCMSMFADHYIEKFCRLVGHLEKQPLLNGWYN